MRVDNERAELNKMQKCGIEAFAVAFILGILVWVIFWFVSYVFSFSPVFEASQVMTVFMQADVILFGFAAMTAAYVSKGSDVQGATRATVALVSFFCYFLSIISGVLWIFGVLNPYSFVAFLPFSYTSIGILFMIIFLDYVLLENKKREN